MLEGWVRTHAHFGVPLCRLVVPRDHTAMLDRIAETLERCEGGPAGLADALHRLAVTYRPDLAGGSLVAFRFDFEYGCWEFLYTHPSFGRQRPGDVLPRAALVPDAGEVWPDAVGFAAAPAGAAP